MDLPLGISQEKVRQRVKFRLPPKLRVKLKGRHIYLYGIGWLALMCNVTSQSIRLWEKNSILPSPIFKVHVKNRYYTAQEIIYYSQVIGSYRGYRACNKGNKIPSKLASDLLTLRNQLVSKFSSSPSAVLSCLKQEQALVARKAYRYRQRQLRRLEKHLGIIVKARQQNL